MELTQSFETTDSHCLFERVWPLMTKVRVIKQFSEVILEFSQKGPVEYAEFFFLMRTIVYKLMVVLCFIFSINFENIGLLQFWWDIHFFGTMMNLFFFFFRKFTISILPTFGFHVILLNLEWVNQHQVCLEKKKFNFFYSVIMICVILLVFHSWFWPKY